MRAGETIAGARFDDADLACADLQETALTRVTFSGGSAAAANFSGAVIEDSDFVGVDLVDADFSGARLVDVRFERSSLMGAVIDNAELSGVEFVDTICPDGVDSDEAGGTCDGHGLTVAGS